MVDMKMLPVSGSDVHTIASTELDVSDCHEIKAFLWDASTNLIPLCQEAVYDKTGEFDGEWVSIF